MEITKTECKRCRGIYPENLVLIDEICVYCRADEVEAIPEPQKLAAQKLEKEQLGDLEKLQLEFKHFRKLVTMQMASIGGGGEVRLLNLDDVDTSSLGNGKFLTYNATTKKLEFTDQVDGN